MIDKWISFNREMIPLIMNGKKTQMRQAIRPQPAEWYWIDGRATMKWKWCIFNPYDGDPIEKIIVDCPYGASGTILGVKEGYRIKYHSGHVVSGIYLSDDTHFDVMLMQEEYDKWTRRKCPYRATPGRFMYRSLCRTKLEVLSIRVARVQDISYADIDAEGTPPIPGQMSYRNDYYQRLKDFAFLWDSINKKRGYAWDSNPWVWVIEFERIGNA